MSVVQVSTFPPEGLVGRLAESGLTARLLVDPNGLDRRLEIRAPDRLVRVELLGPLAELLDPPCWHAVRVAARTRAVWCGPPRTCEDEGLHRFVLDLLARSPAELAERWQRLG